MRLNTAIEHFLSGYFSTCQRSDKTVRAYTTDLRQFREAFPARTTLASLRVEALERWAVTLRERGYASASIRRKFATLRVFLNYWVRRGRLERSPLWLLRLDLAKEKVLPRVLSTEDTRALLRRAKHELGRYPRRPTGRVDATFLALRNLAMVELLFATGIRVGELAALRVADFQRLDRSFLVRGKGARQRLALLADDRSQRILDLYADHRQSLPADHNALFVNHFGRPISTQGVANVVARLARNAGIERRVTPHMLRHTIATLLLRSGADIRVVQEFLGHASITTTQRYTHVTKRHLDVTLRRHHPNRRGLARL